ncbi:hypothetical protein [Neobacillus sp. DY30]|uniref:hypothetical protein n=1 Tax=Neobacillus sp. DY30 TaxID=3047871 RepID=UPI0024BFE9E8|nr:hypothetical protein [Neobacillus sp. DY30]WHX98039.1 hypothetical protein QNH29_15285 [Neobacillus sp. DY30]
MIDIERLILETFIYEENTIFHVENFLKHKNIKLTRKEIKERLNDMLQTGFIKFHDDPSNGQVKFMDSSDEFEEDYWFVLTEKGKRKLYF